MPKKSVSGSMELNPASISPVLASCDPRLDRVISRRWKEVEPWVIIQAKKRKNWYPASISFDQWIKYFRLRHRDIVLRLRKLGFEMREIRRLNMDDLSITEEVRRAAFYHTKATGFLKNPVRKAPHAPTV